MVLVGVLTSMLLVFRVTFVLWRQNAGEPDLCRTQCDPGTLPPSTGADFSQCIWAQIFAGDICTAGLRCRSAVRVRVRGAIAGSS